MNDYENDCESIVVGEYVVDTDHCKYQLIGVKSLKEARENWDKNNDYVVSYQNTDSNRKNEPIHSKNPHLLDYPIEIGTKRKRNSPNNNNNSSNHKQVNLVTTDKKQVSILFMLLQIIVHRIISNYIF